MVEGVNCFLYVASEFFLYLLAYKVILNAKIEQSIVKWGLTILGISIVQVIVYATIGENACRQFAMLTMIGIPIFLLDRDRRGQYLIMYPFVVVASSLVGVSMSYIFALFMHESESKIIEDTSLSIGCQFVSIGVLLLLWLFQVRSRKCYEIKLGWKQYVLFYVVLLCLLFIVAPIQLLAGRFPEETLIAQVAIASSIAAIMLVAVTIWKGILENRELMREKECIEQEEYIINQKQYYENLLAQDEKMRRFRHDMNAHIRVLQSYCEGGANDKIEHYLQKIIKESALYDKTLITGNTAIDAVLTPLFDLAEHESIEIVSECHLPEKLDAEKEFQICTVISNLFRNAIEACDKIEDKENRKVHIKTGMYNSQIVIMISNTISENVPVHGNKLSTSKADKKNHGLGSGNVERIVNLYSGMIEYQCKNGWFNVDVVMQML